MLFYFKICTLRWCSNLPELLWWDHLALAWLQYCRSPTQHLLSSSSAHCKYNNTNSARACWRHSPRQEHDSRACWMKRAENTIDPVRVYTRSGSVIFQKINFRLIIFKSVILYILQCNYSFIDYMHVNS